RRGRPGARVVVRRGDRLQIAHAGRALALRDEESRAEAERDRACAAEAEADVLTGAPPLAVDDRRSDDVIVVPRIIERDPQRHRGARLGFSGDLFRLASETSDDPERP